MNRAGGDSSIQFFSCLVKLQPFFIAFCMFFFDHEFVHFPFLFDFLAEALLEVSGLSSIESVVDGNVGQEGSFICASISVLLRHSLPQYSIIKLDT